MEGIKAVFSRGKKRSRAISDASASDQATSNTRSKPTISQSNPSHFTSGDTLSFPDGVQAWHNCPEATLDICFVHGLTGNRDSTWTVQGQSAPWPKMLLPLKLPNARLLTYGYDAYIVRKSVASTNRLIDHATNLLTDLTNERVSCSNRRLVFVAHSLGGLVCKETILLSRNNPEPHLRGIFDCVTGIVFMGTPHKGSWMADWASIPASALGLVKSTNKSLLAILEADNQLLESIQLQFLSMIRELRESGRRLEVICFFEELPLPLAGQVVSKESATLEGYPSISVHANHKQMVRFGSSEDTGFKRLLGELVRWEAQVRHTQVDSVQSVSEPSPLSQDCLKSLAFPEMHSRLYDVSAAAKGTCEWLFQSETYKNWTICNRGLLWIKGKPGSGKSTLLRHALGKARAEPNILDATLILSFFFHGRGAELQRTPLGLFRSLLHQLLQKDSNALLDLVTTFQERRDSVGEPGEKWHWHREELRSFLKSSLPKVLASRPVLLFVDALDECGEENALDLIGEFKSLLQELPSAGLEFRICFTSREYPVLDRDSRFEISVDHENGEDISTYVKAQLSACRVGEDLIPVSIQALITRRASGIFMWARLVVKDILELARHGKGLKTIEKKINAVPPDLDELYRELIRSMDERSASLKLIQWICLSTRPLSVDEMRWAMIVKLDFSQRSLQECKSDEDYVSDGEMMKMRVQKLSCGLAEIVPSSYTQIVQFIHQSVKDFFVEKGLSALEDRSELTVIDHAKADFAVGIAHYQLSRTCIRYLAMEEITQLNEGNYDSQNSAFPLLEYAAMSWTEHVQKSETKNISQDDLLDYFAWPSEHLLRSWLRVYHKRCLTRYGLRLRYMVQGARMIHIVSRYGFLSPLRLILERAKEADFDIDVKSTGGRTSLSYAAEEGREHIAQLLLENNADVAATDRYRETPLHYASNKGHVEIVKMLLEKGANVTSANENRETSLHCASREGHVEVVKMLLDKGADVASANVYEDTSLHYASEVGYVEVVKMLLENGADVASANVYGETSLNQASREGHVEIVKMLLENGADVAATDRYGETQLSWALNNGHEEIFQLLTAAAEEAGIATADGHLDLI